MILLISAVFPPEPVVSATISYDLAVILSEDHEVIVLTPRSSRPYGFCFKNEPPENRRFNQIILNSYTCPESKLLGRMRESYCFGKHAVKYIRKNRTKIAFIYINAWPLLAQYLIVRISKKYGIPSIIQVDDIYPEVLLKKLPFFKNLFFKLVLPIDKYVLRNSTEVITISPKMKNYLVETRCLRYKKIDVVYNWQNERRFLQFKSSGTNTKRTQDFTFMYLGNLNRTASIDTIIYAFNKSCILNSRLIIAGDGPEKESLISIVATLENVKIEFWDAPVKQVPEIQAAADVLLLSLKKDASLFALPSKLSSYMFSEKPVIACVEDESGTAEAIRQANCGWIVPPEDLDALAEIMKKVVYISKSDLRDLGLNGFNYAMENFSKKTNLQKMVNIINETSRF